MKFVNLTEHTINVVGKNATAVEPSGKSLRVSQEMTPVHPAEVGGDDTVEFYRAKYGPLEMIDNATKQVVSKELPPATDDTVYIVSGQCLDALKGVRADFAAPGQLIRDENGQPVGCKGLKIN